ncbi:Uncharacterized protein SCF082_LOCUS16844 [Durusdinium trenchii]|uniref:Nudix hydrolase domain-containing protein n=1 Tax=Durusdinium trenchii TaxID=1381693 RepID=A0ABP0KDQ6_9DINO
MVKKKSKVAKGTASAAPAAVEQAPPKEEKTKTAKDQQKATNAPADVAQVSESAYKAAAVVFFSRHDDGRVAQVLVALEERKVAASFLGLEEKGKVNQLLVVFPMGRKEKKDKNDAVETAKREYIEETLDFGALARFLDFADFDGGGDVLANRIAPGQKVPMTWSGADNMALYFPPARMTVLFCEVPPGEVQQDEEPPSKKRRQEVAAELEAKPKPSPTYRVGKAGHLQPMWVDAAILKDVANSKEKAPKLSLAGKECRFFPTNASLLRMQEAKAWLKKHGSG